MPKKPSGSGKITRKEFVRKTAVGAAALGAAAIGLSGTANGAMAPPPADAHVVEGKDDPSVDVKNVQAAVDLGGTVLLKGTFDFGTDSGSQIIVPGRPYPDQDRKGESTVFVYANDVTILGERDADGNLLTVIKNGKPAFWIGWDGITHRSPPSAAFGVELFPVDAAGNIYGGVQLRFYQPYWPRVTIEGISFEHPVFRAFGVGACSGFTCRGNKVVDAQYDLMNINGLAESPIQYSAGAGGCVSVFVAPFVFPPQIHPFLPPGFEWVPSVEGIKGNIVIEDNIFEGMGVTDTTSIAAFPNEFVGTGVMFSNAASILISNNRMRNLGLGRALEHGFGVILNDNYPAGSAPATLNVLKNKIENSAGFGVQDFQVYYDVPGAVITDNELRGCGAAAIQVLGKSGSVIKNNRIQDAAIGVWLSGYQLLATDKTGAKKCYVGQNRVEGDSMFGALIGDYSSGNIFVGNNVSGLSTPYGATYFLDSNASGNVIKGDSGTVIDLGANNLITGLTPMQGAPQLGPKISALVQKIASYRLDIKMPGK